MLSDKARQILAALPGMSQAEQEALLLFLYTRRYPRRARRSFGLSPLVMASYTGTSVFSAVIMVGAIQFGADLGWWAYAGPALMGLLTAGAYVALGWRVLK